MFVHNWKSCPAKRFLAGSVGLARLLGAVLILMTATVLVIPFAAASANEPTTTTAAPPVTTTTAAPPETTTTVPPVTTTTAAPPETTTTTVPPVTTTTAAPPVTTTTTMPPVTATTTVVPPPSGQGGGAESDWVSWSGHGLSVSIDPAFSEAQHTRIASVLKRFTSVFAARVGCAPPLRIVRREMSGIKGSYGGYTISLDPNRGVNGVTLAHELMHHLDLRCDAHSGLEEEFKAAQGLPASRPWLTTSVPWSSRPVEQFAEAGVYLTYGRSRMTLSEAALNTVRRWAGLPVRSAGPSAVHVASSSVTAGSPPAATTLRPDHPFRRALAELSRRDCVDTGGFSCSRIEIYAPNSGPWVFVLRRGELVEVDIPGVCGAPPFGRALRSCGRGLSAVTVVVLRFDR